MKGIVPSGEFPWRDPQKSAVLIFLGELTVNNSKSLMYATVAGAIAINLSLALAAKAEAPVYSKIAGYERCAGTFVSAGKNDCKSGSHECSGQSKKVDATNWVYVPAGTCDKISGAKILETVKPQG